MSTALVFSDDYVCVSTTSMVQICGVLPLLVVPPVVLNGRDIRAVYFRGFKPSLFQGLAYS